MTVQSTFAATPARRAHVGDRAAQQLDAVGAGERRVVVGEVLADVAKAGGGEEGVYDCVGHDIGVTVPGKPTFTVEPHAAQHQRPARVVAEGVDVDTLSDAHGTHVRHSTSATSRSVGDVTFRLAGSPSTSTTFPPAASTSDASSVPSG